MTAVIMRTSESVSKSIALATEPLLLDRAGQRRDVIVDEERIEDRDRQGAQQRASHQRAPLVDVARHQLGQDRDRDRLLLAALDESQRVDELVPGQGEGEDAGG